jgi:hypothetical protein
VSKMSAKELRYIVADLLFDIPIPHVGDETSPTSPNFLVAASMDAACREADSMRVLKATVTIGAVKKRFEREAGQLIRKYRSLL